MKPNNVQKNFQSLAAGYFAMGAYNTINNVKSKQLRDDLERERIKKTELQNNLESLTNKNNEQLDIISEQNKAMLETIQELAKSKSNSSSNYISDIFDSFQKFFDSLNFEQTLAITHISGSILIIISLLSIITILCGDYLVKYFNLENKYPKIVRFIRFRRNVKNIEIFLTLIIIFIVLFTIIYINILIFTTY